VIFNKSDKVRFSLIFRKRSFSLSLSLSRLTCEIPHVDVIRVQSGASIPRVIGRVGEYTAIELRRRSRSGNGNKPVSDAHLRQRAAGVGRVARREGPERFVGKLGR
jgi:hypothetical protein